MAAQELSGLEKSWIQGRLAGRCSFSNRGWYTLWLGWDLETICVVSDVKYIHLIRCHVVK